MRLARLDDDRPAQARQHLRRQHPDPLAIHLLLKHDRRPAIAVHDVDGPARLVRELVGDRRLETVLGLVERVLELIRLDRGARLLGPRLQEGAARGEQERGKRDQVGRARNHGIRPRSGPADAHRARPHSSRNAQPSNFVTPPTHPPPPPPPHPPPIPPPPHPHPPPPTPPPPHPTAHTPGQPTRTARARIHQETHTPPTS